MAHYYYPLPYSGFALPQLVQVGHSCTCNPNKQRYAQSCRVFLFCPKLQVQGYHDELKAHHPHSKPYSVLALPWLSLGGRGNLTLWQPRWTPSEPPNNQRYAQNNRVFLTPDFWESLVLAAIPPTSSQPFLL